MKLRARVAALGLTVATFLLACAALEAIAPWHGEGPHRGPTEIRRVVEERHPQVVFLGNSMVGDNLDGDAFARATGLATVRAYQHGSASAWWYETLVHDLLAVERPPATVVLLFRDHFLTHPSFRVLGPFSYRLAEHEAWTDPLVYALAYRPALGALAPLYRDWPLFRNRDQEKRLAEGAVERGLEHLFGIPPGSTDQAVAVVFNDANLDPAQRTIRQQMAEDHDLDPELFDFPARVGESFLPHMIARAKRRGVELVLVRMKKRRDLTPGAAPEPLRRYVSDLRAYLEAEGVPFLDLSEDPRLGAELFSWGDHYTDEGRTVFTQLLAEELTARGVLPAGHAPSSAP